MDHFNFCTAARCRLRYFQVTRGAHWVCTINLDSINYRSAEHTSTSGLIGLANIARGSFLFTKLIREDSSGAQMFAERIFQLVGN
jgi:hypothetical protein